MSGRRSRIEFRSARNHATPIVRRSNNIRAILYDIIDQNK